MITRPMITPGQFLAAYCLDWIAGDPRWLPHPVRLMGRAISAGERLLLRPGKPANEILRGGVLTGAVAGGSWLGARLVAGKGRAIAQILLAWTTLATRSLVDESSAVIEALEADELELARRRLALIVGRDTESLDQAEILRAVIETIAEGFCDGVVAPLVYLAVGGVPLALAYKAVNTLDSMIGHPEPPYGYFGRVAARLDDAANFLPARLAALAIVAGAVSTGHNARQAWVVFRRDGHKHPSPNAGQTEAAMAGALGVRLGGMNYYGGHPSPKPLLGEEGRCATPADARAALRIVAVASVAVFAAAWLWLNWASGARRKRADA
jgi:adenosylcobinamide-phosphate synthase